MVVSLLGCDRIESPPSPPPIPQSAPQNSIWVGGLDGGVFVALEVDDSGETPKYWGEVYYISGDLAYRGYFRTEPRTNATIQTNNPQIYQGWDGDTFYLTNNRRLIVD